MTEFRLSYPALIMATVFAETEEEARARMFLLVRNNQDGINIELDGTILNPDNIEKMHIETSGQIRGLRPEDDRLYPSDEQGEKAIDVMEVGFM